MTIGPNKLLRYLEAQSISQGRRIDTCGTTTLNGMAVRMFPNATAAETMVAVGNSQTVRQFDCRTQVGTNATMGVAGFNVNAVAFNPVMAKYFAVGSSEAVYESVLGATWTQVPGAASTLHSLFGIDSGGAYALAVGGLNPADAIYHLKTTTNLFILTAPALFTHVTYSPQADRFICAGASTIYAFNANTNGSSLLETHPEGSTCTVLDTFYDPIADSVQVVLRLPSGAIRVTCVRGSGMTVTRSVATASTFTSQTLMRGTWTRYNGPCYVFSGEGTVAPRQTAAMLTAPAAIGAPEANVAYDPLKATTYLPSVVADSSIRDLVRMNDLLFVLTSGPGNEQRIYQMSDQMPSEVA